MPLLLRILVASLVMLAVAAVVYALSRGHVFFFPFLLVLGAPVWWLLRPPQGHSPAK